MAGAFDAPPDFLGPSHPRFHAVPGMHPFPPVPPDFVPRGPGPDFGRCGPRFPGDHGHQPMWGNPHFRPDGNLPYEEPFDNDEVEEDTDGEDPRELKLSRFTVNVNFRKEGEEKLQCKVPISVHVSEGMTLLDVWSSAESIDESMQAASSGLLDYVDLWTRDGKRCIRRPLRTFVTDPTASFQTYVFVVAGPRESKPTERGRGGAGECRTPANADASAERGKGRSKEREAPRTPPYLYSKEHGFIPNVRTPLSREKSGKEQTRSSLRQSQRDFTRGKDRRRDDFPRPFGNTGTPLRRTPPRRTQSQKDLHTLGMSPHGVGTRGMALEEPIFANQMEMMGQEMMPQRMYFPEMTGRPQEMNAPPPFPWRDMAYFGGPPMGPIDLEGGPGVPPWVRKMPSPFSF